MSSTVCEYALSHVELLEVQRFSPGWAASCNGMKVTVFVPWRGQWSNFTGCEAARAALIVSFFTILVKSSNAVFEIAPPLLQMLKRICFLSNSPPFSDVVYRTRSRNDTPGAKFFGSARQPSISLPVPGPAERGKRQSTPHLTSSP